MRFMVKAQWNQAPSDEAMALVPAEQARLKAEVNGAVETLAADTADPAYTKTLGFRIFGHGLEPIGQKEIALA